MQDHRGCRLHHPAQNVPKKLMHSDTLYHRRTSFRVSPSTLLREPRRGIMFPLRACARWSRGVTRKNEPPRRVSHRYHFSLLFDDLLRSPSTTEVSCSAISWIFKTNWSCCILLEAVLWGKFLGLMTDSGQCDLGSLHVCRTRRQHIMARLAPSSEGASEQT